MCKAEEATVERREVERRRTGSRARRGRIGRFEPQCGEDTGKETFVVETE
jgi:hypothetical protein